MVSIPVLDTEGKMVAQRELDEKTFLSGKAGAQAVKMAVVSHLARRRQGTHATKTRAQVSGSGKKPWRQKGTGRARAGSRTSPVWRGGGIVFGPHPHKYHPEMNRAELKLARDSALRQRLMDGSVKIVKDISLDEGKTKKAAQVLKNMGVDGSALIVMDRPGQTLRLAVRNLPGVDLVRRHDLNAYDLLAHRHVVFSEDAFDALTSQGEKAAAS